MAVKSAHRRTNRSCEDVLEGDKSRITRQKSRNGGKSTSDTECTGPRPRVKSTGVTKSLFAAAYTQDICRHLSGQRIPAPKSQDL